MDKKKIDGKTAVTFTGTAQAARDQEVIIYGGSNIKRIRGISTMNPNSMLIGNATKLVELECTNATLLTDINEENVKNVSELEIIDVKRMLPMLIECYKEQAEQVLNNSNKLLVKNNR